MELQTFAMTTLLLVSWYRGARCSLSFSRTVEQPGQAVCCLTLLAVVLLAGERGRICQKDGRMLFNRECSLPSLRWLMKSFTPTLLRNVQRRHRKPDPLCANCQSSHS